MTFDERGRLWIAECRSYPKWNTHVRDRVLVFEPSAVDGSLGTPKACYEGIDCITNLSGLEVGIGGAWLLCTPNLIFIPDADGDGVADGEPVVVLDGWDPKPGEPHHVANHLLWGPDGWLYGCLGCVSNSRVAAPGTPDEDRVALNASIWRFHPQLKKFEVVASGTCNPWGIDFDALGQLFASNNVVAHLWHIVPGGRYERTGHGEIERASYEVMTNCADHLHWAGDDKKRGQQTDAAGGGHSHAALMVYQGDNFPLKYQGAAMLCNLHGRRVVYDVFDRPNPEIIARHGGDLLRAADPGFRGVDLKYGPDGTVYLCDWSAIGECHSSDSDALVPTGRIYRIAYKTPRVVRVDLSRQSDEELVGYHAHANEWFARRARLVLQDRAYRGTLGSTTQAALSQWVGDLSKPLEHRLRALWTLHVIGGLGGVAAAALLSDPAPEIRGWAVRLALESPDDNPQILEAVQKLAREEREPQVRRELISALQRVGLRQRGAIAKTVLAGLTDSDPRNWQRLAWYALEPLVLEEPQQMVELDESLICSFLNMAIARRVAERWRTDRSNAAMSHAFDALVTHLPEATQSWQLAVLDGLREGLRGNRELPPDSWLSVAGQLSHGASDTQALVRSISAQFGEGHAQKELLAVLRDRRAGSDRRLQAMADCLARPDEEKLVPLLLELCSDPDHEVGRQAILGLAAFKYVRTPVEILKMYPTFDRSRQQAAIELLASRVEYAPDLLSAVEAGKILPTALRADVVRQMFALGDPEIAGRLRRLWGLARSLDEDARKEINRLSDVLSPQTLAQGDMRHGKQLFDRTCGNCHVLFGSGQAAGPNLTGAQRDNLGRLLTDIVDPSAVVGRQFQVTLVQTTDGRVITGLVVEESDDTVSIRTQTSTVRLEKREIAERKLLSESFMPRGILGLLSDSDIRDLFTYLMAKTPLD
jgi:putative membrane-bound dehydrogenase-like protein